MGNAPAAARLTIVSIRATGVINTLWAIFVAAAATLFLVFGGGAWQALAIYFVAHILSSTLVLITLKRNDHVPPGMVQLFSFSTVFAALLAALAIFRGYHPEYTTSVTAVMALVFVLAASTLFLLGREYRWLPSAVAVRSGLVWVQSRLRRSSPYV